MILIYFVQNGSGNQWNVINNRSAMDANGVNMDKKWQKAIPVHELIIGAPWQPPAQFANKYVYNSLTKLLILKR